MDHRGQLRFVKVGVPSCLGVHMFDLSARPSESENRLWSGAGNYRRIWWRRCLKDDGQVPITFFVASEDRFEDRVRRGR